MIIKLTCRLIALSMLFCLGCNAVNGSAPIDASEATFSDPALEEAVRSAAGKTTEPLNHNDLLAIDKLDLSDTLVVSIIGLDALRNLTYLDIRDTMIWNLAVLAELPQLETLKFNNTWQVEIKNCSAIASLANLETLDIQGLDDWAFLADLPELKSLSINGPFGIEFPEEWEAFGDMLGTFGDLEELIVKNNYFRDISFLRDLPNLEILNLSYNDVGIYSLAPLAGMDNLQELTVINSYVEDISALTDLPFLRDVDIRWNCITDFAAVIDVEILVGDDDQADCYDE